MYKWNRGEKLDTKVKSEVATDLNLYDIYKLCTKFHVYLKSAQTLPFTGLFKLY